MRTALHLHFLQIQLATELRDQTSNIHEMFDGEPTHDFIQVSASMGYCYAKYKSLFQLKSLKAHSARHLSIEDGNNVSKQGWTFSTSDLLLTLSNQRSIM